MKYMTFKRALGLGLIACAAVAMTSCGGGDDGMIMPRPDLEPDLDIRNFRVNDSTSDATLTAGASFTIRADVYNFPSADPVSGVILRYYRSTNNVISRSDDTRVGSDTVGSLGAGQTSSQSITLTAPTTAGVYYYGACVDEVAGERDPGDDCTTNDEAIRVTVTGTTPPTRPDLDIRNFRVNDSTSDATLTAGASFTIRADVYNFPSADPASGVILRYYRSTNNVISRSDTRVGSDTVGSLGAGETSSQSITLTAPTTAGVYYYGACVDEVAGERDPRDDCTADSEAIRVTVTGTTPPVTIATPTIATTNPVAGGTITGNGRITNNGASAARVSVDFLWSDDTVLSSDDSRAAASQNLVVPAGGSTSYNYQATVPQNIDSVVYFCVCIDGRCSYVPVRPTTDDPNTMPIRDFNVAIPNSCPREVEICVRDHQCIDGDRVRVTLNGNIVFADQELVSAFICQRVPVTAGTNSVVFTALNGTGGKGFCDHSDANSGEIEIRGGTSSESRQSWLHAGGEGSSANLNITIGGSGGCLGTPTPPPTRSRRALATTEILERLSGDRGPNLAWAYVTGHSTQQAAQNAALSECRNSANSRGTCAHDSDFGSAYSGRNECLAIAYGVSSSLCFFRSARENSVREAESAALAACRSAGATRCWIPTGSRRGRASVCSN